MKFSRATRGVITIFFCLAILFSTATFAAWGNDMPEPEPPPSTPTPIQFPQPSIPPSPTPEPAISTNHQAFMIGFEDGTIRPNAPTTRAQAATIFFRLMSDTDRALYWRQDNAFTDVHLHNWFNNAISTTANAGMITGMPDGTFQPNRPITKKELFALAARFMETVPLADTPMLGNTTGNWPEPYKNITRAETAAFINHMLNRLNPDHLPPTSKTWPDNTDNNAWYYMYIQEATNAYHYTPTADARHRTQLIPPRDWAALERPDSRP